MVEEGLTLEELSARTGVEARTLRSWVAEGLLAPPYRPGRGSRYPAGNADRALAVRALKDVHGLSLAEIGRRFMLATEEEIRGWAREARPAGTSAGSARDYLRRIGARGVFAEDPAPRPRDAMPGKFAPRGPDGARLDPGFGSPPKRPHHPALSGMPAEDLSSIERLILQLEKLLEAPAPRRARGAVWTRIPITPDLELSVRGELAPRERVLFEQLADQFRAILTGRTRHD